MTSLGACDKSHATMHGPSSRSVGGSTSHQLISLHNFVSRNSSFFLNWVVFLVQLISITVVYIHRVSRLWGKPFLEQILLFKKNQLIEFLLISRHPHRYTVRKPSRRFSPLMITFALHILVGCFVLTHSSFYNKDINTQGKYTYSLCIIQFLDLTNYVSYGMTVL